jgi:2-oxoglutarate ferredoxin oxidoreductase subunit delta
MLYLNVEKCKSCDLCLDVCPNNLIRYSNDYNSNNYRVIEIYNKDFCFGQKCSYCVNICPDQVFIFKENTKNNWIPAFFYWLGKNYSKTIRKIKK